MTIDPSCTFVLIPGAGGSAFYWYRLVAELDRRGYASVAVELPAADESAGLPEYAAVVLDAIDGITTPIVVVAQSRPPATGGLPPGRPRPASSWLRPKGVRCPTILSTTSSTTYQRT